MTLKGLCLTPRFFPANPQMILQHAGVIEYGDQPQFIALIRCDQLHQAERSAPPTEYEDAAIIHFMQRHTQFIHKFRLGGSTVDSRPRQKFLVFLAWQGEVLGADYRQSYAAGQAAHQSGG